jgi:hypothetical protein
VADVPDVAVAGVNLGAALRQWHAVGFGVVEAVLAALQFPLAPRRDDLEFRGEGLVGVLEADLVIAFAGAAVGHGLCALSQCGEHLVFGDDGPRDGGAEQVLVLVDGAGADGGKYVVAEKLFAQVEDDGLLRAGRIGFGHDCVQIVALAHVGDHGDHVHAVIFVEPGNDDGGVEASRVCQYNFLCHEFSLLQSNIPSGAKAPRFRPILRHD